MNGAVTRRVLMAVAGLVVVVVVVSSAVFMSYQRDLEHARQRVASGAQVVQTPCGPIEFASAGAGPAVLVVHGAGGGYDQGLAFGEDLVRSGFRVLAMSRFGYLGTPLPDDASAPAQADAHACLLDALKIDRAAIIGASAGAPSTLQFALRHPKRCQAMVLLVPAVYVPRPGGAPSIHSSVVTEFLVNTALQSDFLFWAAIRIAPDTVLRALLATPPAVVAQASAAEQARVARMMENLLPVSPRAAGLLNDGAVIASLKRYELEDITVPALVISVADDLFGTYEAARYTAEHLTRGRFIAYPSGGHLWVGHQAELVAELVAFLK